MAPLSILSRPYDGRAACDFNGQGWYGCGAEAVASNLRYVVRWDLGAPPPMELRNREIVRACLGVFFRTCDSKETTAVESAPFSRGARETYLSLTV